MSATSGQLTGYEHAGKVPMNDPDAALMLDFARGNDEAFVTLYRKYRDRMIAYCMRLLGERAVAEDAAQDVFLKLHGTRASYKAQSRFSTFLYTIATRHCFNMRARLERKLVKRGVSVEDQPTGARDADAEVENAELGMAIVASLTALPEKQRAALVLVHHEGLTYRDAASVIDVSESAVKSLVFRARETLMQELLPMYEPMREVKHAL